MFPSWMNKSTGKWQLQTNLSEFNFNHDSANDINMFNLQSLIKFFEEIIIRKSPALERRLQHHILPVMNNLRNALFR